MITLYEHAELGRHHVQPLGDLHADPGHLATTAGAEGAFGFNDATEIDGISRLLNKSGLKDVVPAAWISRRFSVASAADARFGMLR
ncbi:hypothetical protein, partial [Roseovarius sp. D0-M9]|uniref:hypothetical protein n=1 Tax=Roseovarius sp. D0-M9 TaxID=3127117 RepID=UPI00300FC6DF